MGHNKRKENREISFPARRQLCSDRTQAALHSCGSSPCPTLTAPPTAYSLNDCRVQITADTPPGSEQQDRETRGATPQVHCGILAKILQSTHRGAYLVAPLLMEPLLPATAVVAAVGGGLAKASLLLPQLVSLRISDSQSGPLGLVALLEPRDEGRRHGG
ncbi:unnamed protein product [Miscanthus lutarioriparius]|uniref:Uncharacterized protein n=1 Tax=Miscanthus lutarioriparius TaxID=422564 RepID=A0A811PRU1_9POAL|nr:unnamed protein product [Miscanthus lutarioriparius]